MSDPTNGDMSTTVMAGITMAMGSLAGAVTMLWKLGESKNAAAIAELRTDRDSLKIEAAECRKDREDFRVKLAENKAKTDALQHQLSLYIKKHAGDVHG
jgi:hypothetical protein